MLHWRNERTVQGRVCAGDKGCPQHMPTLGTPPDGHAHEHQHPHLEPSAAFPPFATPRHPHQPRLTGRMAPGSPLWGPPPSPNRQYRHHRPRRLLNHSGIRHPPPNKGPPPQQGTPHAFSTAPNVASVSALPPIPHTNGTSCLNSQTSCELPQLPTFTPRLLSS